MATATAEEYINSMYENKRKSTLAGLESEYNQNVNKLDTQEAEIPKTYYEARREATASDSKAKLNMNESNAASGLNSGTVGQMHLARSNAASATMSDLLTQEATAKSDLAQTRADLETTYRNNVQSAIADNDFDKANALFSEYKDNRDLARTQVDKLVSAGVMPSASLIAESGYSTDYVSKLYSALN